MNSITSTQSVGVKPSDVNYSGYYANSDSVSNSYSDSYKVPTRNTDMSLAICVAFPNAFYLAADSQSSKMIEEGYTGSSPFARVLSFSSKKIFRIQETTIFGYSTGLNKFGDYNLQGFIRSLDLPNDINECGTIISNKLNTFDKRHTLALFNLFTLTKDGLHIVSVIGDENTHLYSSKYSLYTPATVDSFRLIRTGATWATELARFAPFTSEEDVKSVIEKLYRDAEFVGRFYDNCVGGPIHILKVTPNGYNWIVGGYDL